MNDGFWMENLNGRPRYNIKMGGIYWTSSGDGAMGSRRNPGAINGEYLRHFINSERMLHEAYYEL